MAKKIFKYIPSFLTNKFLITGVLFMVWMTFFDPKDISADIAKNKKLQELQKSEQHFNQLIVATRYELNQLNNNAQTMEKYARENCLMKKDNEDLFIIPDKKTSK